MYADPSPTNPIASSVAWLQATLLGSIAATAAMIAVASVGFLMLTGRIDLRRAVQVVFGCFILFGASSIAQGIITGMNGLGAQQVSERVPEPLPDSASPPPTYAQGKPAPYDPYAGAAVPTQQ